MLCISKCTRFCNSAKPTTAYFGESLSKCKQHFAINNKPGTLFFNFIYHSVLLRYRQDRISAPVWAAPVRAMTQKVYVSAEADSPVRLRRDNGRMVVVGGKDRKQSMLQKNELFFARAASRHTPVYWIVHNHQSLKIARANILIIFKSALQKINGKFSGMLFPIGW